METASIESSLSQAKTTINVIETMVIMKKFQHFCHPLYFVPIVK